MNPHDPTPDYGERYAAYWLRLRATPAAYDLFGTLRWLDAICAPHARIGRAAHPRDEPLRLGQTPSLSFAPAMVAHAVDGVTGSVAPRLLIHGFGLFGPNGPMPLHVTERARETVHDANDNALSAFADLFHHRAIALFYRAWADAQPVVGHDRPGGGPFDRYVASLIGRGSRAGSRKGWVLPLSEMCFQAGHWVRHTRNPEGLVRILSHDLRVDVRLVEHVIRWLPIDETQRTTLRAKQPEQCLGCGAVLGRAVRDGQSCFRLVLGPMSLERYRTFLPGGCNARRLAQWVREYIGVEFGWAMQLVLAADQVPRHTLGSSEGLGHSIWLGRRSDTAAACELTIDWTARSGRARLARRAGAQAMQPRGEASANE